MSQHLKMRLIYYTYILSILTFTNCMGRPQNEQMTVSSNPGIDSVIQQVLLDYEIPGLAVVVVNEDSLDATWHYGNAQEETPVDAATLFSAQSLSKTFTALAVLSAVQENLVELDTPIVNYLPNFHVNSIHQENSASLITLRHLLSHTSGLPADAPAGSTFSLEFNRYSTVSLSNRVASVNEIWLKDTIGAHYNYSNIGFDIAAYIIEMMSHQSFSNYVKQHVFDPLEMKQSTFELDAVQKISNRASGHCYGVDEKVPTSFSAIGAGGLYTSSTDMSKFLNAAMHKFEGLLSPETYEKLITIPHSTEKNGYALGLVINEINYCTPFYSHTGNGFGFTASMAWFPDQSIGIALLCNRESAYPGLSQIQQTILEHYLSPETLNADCHKIDEYPSIVAATDKDYYQSIAGNYSNGTTTLVFELRGNAFGILAPDDGTFHQIHFLGKNRWMFQDGNEIHHFKLINERLTNLNNGMTFLKVSNTSNVGGEKKEHWKNYEGRYRSYAYGILESTENIDLINGYLHLNGNKLYEYLPGLFFDQFGQIVDFRGENVQIEYGAYTKIE